MNPIEQQSNDHTSHPNCQLSWEVATNSPGRFPLDTLYTHPTHAYTHTQWTAFNLIATGKQGNRLELPMSSTLSQVLVVDPYSQATPPPACYRKMLSHACGGKSQDKTEANERTQYFFINSLRRRAGNKFCAVNLSHNFSWPITTIGQQQWSPCSPCSSDRTQHTQRMATMAA